MSARPRGPLDPGDRIGAFVVREEIGFGATSIVYEAEHRTVRNRVAIKVLRSLSEMGSELRHRFEREMRLCTQIDSQHVPRVYDVGVLPSGLPYIMMERLNGASLADWLAVHRSLPVAVVVEIGIQLCAALEALHALEVVHRDVKPENLLLHQAFDDGYVLKLMDFGICKPLNTDEPALTREGTVVGTPEYMSPEQVQGLEVDARTDVYSSGVLLYELLAGRTPFQGDDLDLLGRAILFGTAPRLSSLRDDVSPLLEAIIMRALSRDRADRHPSIGALGRELSKFADEYRLRRHPRVWSQLPSTTVPRSLLPPPSEGLARRPHPTLITPRIPVRRSWLFGTSASAFAVMVGAALSIAWFFYEPAERRTLSPNENRSPVVEEPPRESEPNPVEARENTASAPSGKVAKEPPPAPAPPASQAEPPRAAGSKAPARKATAERRAERRQTPSRTSNASARSSSNASSRPSSTSLRSEDEPAPTTTVTFSPIVALERIEATDLRQPERIEVGDRPAPSSIGTRPSPLPDNPY